MRKIWLVGAVVLAAAAYWAWPYAGAYALEQAAVRGDAAAVVERVDFTAVRHGLAKQVIRAYLNRSGRGDKLGAFGRGMAIAVGTSVADPYLSELISPESLVGLLADGRLSPLRVDGRTVAFAQSLPKLSDVLGQRFLSVMLASYYDGPTSFVFHADAANGESYGVHLRLAGTTWRLAGIDLPQPLLDTIADDIVAKEKTSKSS